MSILNQPLRKIHKLLTDGDAKVSELVEASIERMEQVEGDVQAFISVNPQNARQAASELDAVLAKNPDAAEGQWLFGIPAGIKDNIVTKGQTTTCGSQFLKDFNPPYNAAVMEKLHAQHIVQMGKLNMDEFAMGSSNENSSFHATRNPWNTNHVPGGSSGGSAAAIAAGEVPFALGSDTGGSIRQPAAYCGVVGLKPTYGLVSRFGLVAFASSLDQIGPLTRNVEDAAIVLQAIAGHDARDSTSANVQPDDYLAAMQQQDIKGLKIALVREHFGEGIDPGVRERIQEAIDVLSSLGAEVEEVSLPHSEYAVATYYLIASSEASSNLARYDGVRYGKRAASDNLEEMYKLSRSEGFGKEVKRRIMLGTYALSSGYYDAYYLKAQKVRTLMKQDFDQVFANYDVIVGPTAPTTAFAIGSQVNDPLTMYLNDICTIPVNLAGIPAVSIPCGLSDGLPVGLQFIGKAFDESTVLRVANAFEQATAHHLLQPTGIANERGAEVQ